MPKVKKRLRKGRRPKSAWSLCNPPDIVFDALVSQYMKGELNAVVLRCQSLLREYPRSNTLDNLLGATFAGLGRHEEAISHFKAALKGRANEADLHNNIGLSQIALGRAADAIFHFQQSLKYQSGVPEVLASLANAQRLAGNFDLASETLSRLVGSLPVEKSSMRYMLNAGSQLKAIGKFEEALEAFRRAGLIAAPADPEPFIETGLLYSERGEVSQAKEAFEIAIQRAPLDTRGLIRLGALYEDIGSQQEATNQYVRALKIDSTNEEARYHLAKILRLRRRSSEALHYLKNNKYKDSEIFELESLYLAGKTDQFLMKSQEYLSAGGRGHAVLGACEFHGKASGLSEMPNVFCSDPMSFVHIRQVADPQELSKSFDEYWASSSLGYRHQTLLSNGEQTFGNVFADRSHPFIEYLNGVINAEVGLYKEKFGLGNEPFQVGLPGEGEFFIRGWWIKMHCGGSLAAHNHDRGWLSGTIYIKMPKERSGDQGDMLFCPSGGIFPQINSDEYNYKLHLEAGAITLFPSSLFHRVEPFYSNEERICLAFDIGFESRP